jgi:hypothetical protein
MRAAVITLESAGMEWKADDWPQGFTWSESAVAILDQIDQCFSLVQRPVHFTDINHCAECREHDEELSARPRMELRRSDLGGPGWDPITFATPQGVAHLMPALARYCMAPDFWPDSGWYADQMAFHLVHNGRLVQFFDPAQRAAVRSLIGWMIENRANDLTSHASEDDWLAALTVWEAV